jgi:transcriptional regulator with XRE-family HTH domain
VEKPRASREKYGLGQVLSDLGRRVAELRRAQGWTQEQLAEALGLESVSHIKAIEGGRENLTLRSVHDLAVILGTDVRGMMAKPHDTRPRRPGRPPKRP